MMNDDSLTSDDLFKSGTANGSIEYTYGHLVPGNTNQRLDSLSERIQEDNETQVKEFSDQIESLIYNFDDLSLSIDGDQYANIHIENGFQNEREIDADGSQELCGIEHSLINKNNRAVETNSQLELRSELKQPDLPVSSQMKNGFVDKEDESVEKKANFSKDSSVRHVLEAVGNNGDLNSRESSSINFPSFWVTRMADSSQTSQGIPSQNGAGAGLRNRDTDNQRLKTKKLVKDGYSDSDQIPKPPFKLQEKKYDNDFEGLQGNINRSQAEPYMITDDTTSSFPVEYLNPYSNPNTIKTVKPGARCSPDIFSNSVQENDNSRSEVVRPKIIGKKSDSSMIGRGMRHNKSDPLICNADRLVTNRGNTGPIFSANAEGTDHNHKETIETPIALALAEGASGVNVQRKQETEKESKRKQVVRPKARTASNITKTNADEQSNDESKSDRKSEKTRANECINIELGRGKQGMLYNNPPTRIEFINNLQTGDTCTAKKIENKDMKNSNRRNPNTFLVNTNCSSAGNVDSVQDHQSQYQSFEPLIDLGHVSRQNEQKSNKFVNRINKSGNSEKDTSPIIVPYGIEADPVSLPLSYDDSLPSNILFGSGTEEADLMLARMLQEKFDKEHLEMCQRNQYDIAPETLRLHNLTPSFNIADCVSDPSLIGEGLQPDSMLNEQNDVYEVSPRSLESDHNLQPVGQCNSLEFDSEDLQPDSHAQDRVICEENFHDFNQLYPEISPSDGENNNSLGNQDGLQETHQLTSDELYVPYETENHREVLAPESPDESTIYIRAETEGPPIRSDEDFARSLQRHFMIEGEQWDEEYARRLEEEEQQDRRNDYRSHNRARARPSGSLLPLHSRLSMLNSTRQEPSRYAAGRRIQNTWDRPQRQANVYGYRPRRQGYDIYGNEYEPDLMPDPYGEDDYVSISRDPHLLATVLMGRAPNMMVPNNVDLDDYEALWDLAEELGEVRRVGMDQHEISLLPVHTYQAPNTAEGGKGESGDCRVCLTDFNDGERLRTLPCCHIYHVDCIDEWLKRNAVCPVCRQSVRQ